MEPTCSVIVTSYNAMPYSQIMYDTFHHFTHSNNIKLVWTDNGSTDGTVEWLEGLSGIDNLLLFSENHGAGFARHKAVLEVDTDTVCFLDNDIAITQVGWIHRLLRVLLARESIGAVAPAINLLFGPEREFSFTEPIDPLWARLPTYKRKDGSVFTSDEDIQPYINKYLSVLKTKPFPSNIICEGGGTTMRRSTYLDTQGYSKRYEIWGEGARIGDSLREMNLEMWVVPSVFLFHYGHATRNLQVLPDFHARMAASRKRKGREPINDWTER